MRLLLFSGGIDLTALAVWKRPDIALTNDYGQRVAEGELRAARRIAAELGLRHEVLKFEAASLGAGLLADRAPSREAPSPEWWPYRNQFLVTLAAMRYLGEGVHEISVGTVASDSLHGDGRPTFVERFDALLAAQEGQVGLRHRPHTCRQKS